MKKIAIPVAPAHIATSFLEGKEIAQKLGFPLVEKILNLVKHYLDSQSISF